MTSEIDSRPNNPKSGARIGRAAAWFAAGALGATALTGVALASGVPTDDSDSGSAQGQQQDQGTEGTGQGKGRHGGPGGHGKHGGPGGPGGPMLHSEGVIETPDGEFQDFVAQRGQVTEINDSSITVASEDGYTANYTVDPDTKVHKDRSEKSISDVSVGDTVSVKAEKSGNDVVAKHIGAMSPEQAAEAEKKRAEMRQKHEEQRQQKQEDGDTQNSGFYPGPSGQTQTA